jgi:hypothetical protein
MWPDLDIDERLSLTERLLHRIQAFHDFIGLDSQLFSGNERLNSGAMYRIYEEKKLPDTDDGLDDVAAYQRGAALLQRIQAEDPDLWEVITNLPDGIRSAIRMSTASEENPEAARFVQGILKIEGAQMPLMSSGQQAGVASPFDDPKPGETIVLISSGEMTEAYAVGDDYRPRKITSAQFVAAAECEPDTPPRPLPSQTNERVMAGFEAFQAELSQKLGWSRRPSSDTRLRRYLSKQLNLIREQYKDDPVELRRIDVLRRIFLDHVPPRVEAALREIREFQIEGDVLIHRLEALRNAYRLNPPEEDDSIGHEPEVIRIVCSNGLVG